MKLSLCALILGYLLDLAIGDPHFLWHPIRAVGALIDKSEKMLRKVFPRTEKGELWGGACLVLIVAGITTGAAALLLAAAQWVSPWLRLALETVMCYQILATRALRDESMKVYDALKTGTLQDGR